MSRPGSAPTKEPSDAREAWRTGAAETLRTLGHLLGAMADALDEDDGILGALAGEGIANHLPALPSHIRHTFMEYLDDEAARGLRAELAYHAERSPEGASTASENESVSRGVGGSA